MSIILGLSGPYPFGILGFAVIPEPQVAVSEAKVLPESAKDTTLFLLVENIALGGNDIVEGVGGVIVMIGLGKGGDPVAKLTKVLEPELVRMVWPHVARSEAKLRVVPDSSRDIMLLFLPATAAV